MAKINTSLKHVQVDKANTVVVAVVAVAAFAIVFTGFAVSSLLSLRSYQASVIDKKETAKDQLEENIAAIESLKTEYTLFNDTTENVIGGASAGDGERDGSNARLVLDSLPSRYDFPALITSIEKIISAENVEIRGISGSDEEIAQRDMEGEHPIEIPVTYQVTGDYSSIQDLIDAFELSIRPFHYNHVSLRGDDDSMNLEVVLQSYYQPEKRFKVETEQVTQ